MKLFAILLTAASLSIGPAGISPCGSAAYAATGCCKVCKKGKACGDSCIAADKTCHKGSGCACDA
jgi:hypothetical protein